MPSSDGGGNAVLCATVAEDKKYATNHIEGGGNTSPRNEDERLDLAWAKAEREIEARRTSPPQSPPKDDGLEGDASAENYTMNGNVSIEQSSDHESPLMASDVTVQTSNITALSSTTHNETAEPTKPIIANHTNCSTPNEYELMSNKQTTALIQKYRHFLQRHEPSLDILEHIMERFVFYGYLFKHDHRGINTELYYAAWNIFRGLNDVVLVGWGEGMGTTVGRREEWLAQGERSESMLLRLNSAIPIIRAILTATTCIYPAMEAWSRRSLPPLYDTPTSDLSPQKRRHEWEASQSRAARVSYRLERVRFLSRLALLSTSWWAQHRRRCSHGKGDHGAKELHRENEGEGMLLPSLLRRGGELDPYEQLIPLKDAEDEAKVVQYVGRRTGRRSIAGASKSPPTASPSRSCGPSSCTYKATTLVKWLSELASSEHKIFYVYAVGELLHILRPLYWSRAESMEWRRRSSSPKIPRSPSSFAIWKAWWISLLMDLISDKLLQVTHGGDTAPVARHAHQHSTSPSPSAEQAKLQEMEYRRSRHGLYLLRSPMYDAVTRPVVVLIGKIVSMIPSFGLGRWASEYILDLMSYWNQNRFMLES